jgi:hypothetical protein
MVRSAYGRHQWRGLDLLGCKGSRRPSCRGGAPIVVQRWWVNAPACCGSVSGQGVAVLSTATPLARLVLGTVMKVGFTRLPSRSAPPTPETCPIPGRSMPSFDQ